MSLLVFLGGFVWFSCILLYVLYNLMSWEEKGKIQWLLNCCELKETLLLLWLWLLWLLIYLWFIYFLCTSWNGLNFALLASIVYWHKVHPFDLRETTVLIKTLINRECTSKQDEKKKITKSSANPFYFSLIWETIFCMNIITMADILACTKKKCEAIWREKKNVPFLLYLYISKYLLKYVILLILLTIKGFLNKNLFTCFWTLSRLLELDLLLSVTRLKDLCNH